MRWVAWLVVVAIAIACGPEGAIEGETGTSAGAESTLGATASATNGSTTTSTTTSTTGASSTGTTSGGTDESGNDSCDAFICEPDGPDGYPCTTWDEDCSRGDKCMPWANDGGSAWNATKCVPIDPNPKQLGEPCTVVGSGVSGIDDCDFHSMCWDVDPDTNMGHCVAFCDGTAADPSCADPCAVCMITNRGVLTLCLPTCHPIEQKCVCPIGQGCYPILEDFSCLDDESGRGGAYGEPCDSIVGCDPGLFCADAAAVPGCAGVGCCSEFCDLGLADPDSQCTGAAQGQVCTPWYAEGQSPPGYANIGACALP